MFSYLVCRKCTTDHVHALVTLTYYEAFRALVLEGWINCGRLFHLLYNLLILLQYCHFNRVCQEDFP